MQVGRWGNSLAIRLPASIVDLLDLHEGDDIQVEVAGNREFLLSCEQGRVQALRRLRQLNWVLPPGFSLGCPDDDHGHCAK